jgi:hypothetical protein
MEEAAVAVPPKRGPELLEAVPLGPLLAAKAAMEQQTLFQGLP